MNDRIRDMSRAVDMTDRRETGPKRTAHPVYVNLLPPCNNACPAGEEIQGWLGLAQAGKYREAWQRLVLDNPMPAVHGRVCYHPCESACNRSELDSSVSIHAVERFLGDLATQEGWKFKIEAAPTGRRILVIGAGPSGLSAAYHLACMGHSVEIHDAGPVAGGMMQYGIPAYRLPREELLREIRRIEAIGVRIVLNHRVDDIRAEISRGSFDATFLAIGADVGKHVDIPARDAVRVLDAVSLLHDVGAGGTPLLGRRVIVYGGGNTAMDAARTARRLGADEALIVYRRDRSHMPAHGFEADEAIEEGIKIKWLTTIKEIIGPTLTVEIMTLDADGHPKPTGKFETLSADSVVLALGQTTDSGFLHNVPGLALGADGVIVVGANMMTGYAGLFAGGDAIAGERSVTISVGHGKRAARNIDAWLRHENYEASPKAPLVSFEMLHLPVYSDADPNPQHTREAAKRVHNFEEVVSGLDERSARHEAQRCLSCGNCFECDNCFAACPELAIVRLGPTHGYRVNMDLCTGCAVCVEQCPCHAMDMVADSAGVGPLKFAPRAAGDI